MRFLWNFIRRILISATLLGVFWLAGLGFFVVNIPRHSADIPTADAIVVLTGGTGRIEFGLKLLHDRKAPTLFISGAASKKIPLPENFRTLSDKIEVGDQARNTIGNAFEVAGFMKQRGLRHVLLVTSDYHLPRAIAELHYAAPALAITPAPVITTLTPEIVLSEYHKFLAGHLRHAIITLTREEV